MIGIITLATILTPIVTGVVEAVVKRPGLLPKAYFPFSAVVIGVLLGGAAVPIFEIRLAEALWAGGIAGLSSVGLFEIGKQFGKEGSK